MLLNYFHYFIIRLIIVKILFPIDFSNHHIVLIAITIVQSHDSHRPIPRFPSSNPTIPITQSHDSHRPIPRFPSPNPTFPITQSHVSHHPIPRCPSSKPLIYNNEIPLKPIAFATSPTLPVPLNISNKFIIKDI